MDYARLNVVVTLCLAGLWSCKALYLEMAGPSLIDLKLLFNTSYEALSRAVAGRGVGGFIGAVVGGILADKREDWLELILGVTQTLAAMSVFCVPFAPDTSYLWLIYVNLGLFSGIANIAGTRLVLRMWTNRAPSTLSALHMFYGLGALLVSVLVNPFLAVIAYDTPSGQPKALVEAGAVQGAVQPVNPLVQQNQLNTFHVIRESRVKEVILIIGVITLCFSLPFYLFQTIKFRSLRDTRYFPLTQQHSVTKPKTFMEMVNPATYAKGSLWYGLYVASLLMVYFFHLLGGEKIMAHFIRSFSVDVLKFEKDEASYLNMSFWLSFTIGRFVNAVVSIYIPVEKLILAEVCINFLFISVIKYYVTGSHMMLWVFAILQGIFVSPLYPNGVTYGNTLIDVTGMCLMLIVFAQSIGDMTYLWIAGRLYDSFGPTTILSVYQVSAFSLVVVVFLFRINERPKHKTSMHKSFSFPSSKSIRRFYGKKKEDV